MSERVCQIVVINPGSTSTKVAVAENERIVFQENIGHSPEELAHKEVQQQLGMRTRLVLRTLQAAGVDLGRTDAFAGRGGGLKPLESGTYLVDDALLRDARTGTGGQHPAQLAAQICEALRQKYGGKAYVVNPPDVDEFCEAARISGIRGVYRESRVHALNQKEVAYRFCAANGLDYKRTNLIVAHIGGGISVTAHRQGKMIDSNDILHGDGPMAPTRCGSVSVAKVIELCYSGKFSKKEMLEKTTKTGGLMDLLGTADAREIERRIEAGDAHAKLVYDAMIYQIGKSIGSCGACLKGEVRQILLTGGMAHSGYLTGHLRELVGWIAPVTVMAGEFEMEALASGAYRVLTGQEPAALYTGIPPWTPENC